MSSTIPTAESAIRQTLNHEPLRFRSVLQEKDLADCHCWYMRAGACGFLSGGAGGIIRIATKEQHNHATARWPSLICPVSESPAWDSAIANGPNRRRGPPPTPRRRSSAAPEDHSGSAGRPIRWSGQSARRGRDRRPCRISPARALGWFGPSLPPAALAGSLWIGCELLQDHPPPAEKREARLAGSGRDRHCRSRRIVGSWRGASRHQRWF